MRRIPPHVPRPLLALLAAVAVVGIAWSLFTPPFQVPDEGGHFAYVQSIADEHRRPPVGEFFSTHRNAAELDAAEQTARGRTIIEHPEFKPAWTRAYEARFEAARRASVASPEPVAGRFSQADDPPLYYAYEAVPYRLAGPNLFDRLFAMRIWSAALLLLTTTAAWLLAGELFGRDRLLQLVTAGCVGLQPMVTFVSAGVSQDAAAFAAAGFVLWLGVRVLRRGASRRSLAAVTVALVIAALVKTVLLSLVPAVVFALLVGWHRTGAGLPAWRIGGAVVIATGLGLAVSRGLADNLPPVSEMSGFVSYLWQYYLPRLPFQEPIEGLGSFKAWIWLTGSWGRFGWLDVRFPYPVYAVFGVVSLAILVGAGLALRRRRVRIDRAVIAFFAVGAASLVLTLHVADYANLVRTGAPINQGRYLLPLLPLAGLATAATLTHLPQRARARGAAVLLGGMICLQLFSLAIVAGRFYV